MVSSAIFAPVTASAASFAVVIPRSATTPPPYSNHSKFPPASLFLQNNITGTFSSNNVSPSLRVLILPSVIPEY